MKIKSKVVNGICVSYKMHGPTNRRVIERRFTINDKILNGSELAAMHKRKELSNSDYLLLTESI